SESCSRATVAAGAARVGAASDERAQPAGASASASGKHNSREVMAPGNYKNDAGRRLTPIADLRARKWGVEDALAVTEHQARLDVLLDAGARPEHRVVLARAPRGDLIVVVRARRVARLPRRVHAARRVPVGEIDDLPPRR